MFGVFVLLVSILAGCEDQRSSDDKKPTDNPSVDPNSEEHLPAPVQTLVEPDPCANIEIPYPAIESVADNTEFREMFDAPDGDNYVYALLATRKPSPIANKTYPMRSSPIPIKFFGASCVAVRLLVGDDLSIKELKIKPVAGPNTFSEAITFPMVLSVDNRQDSNDDYYKFAIYEHDHDPPRVQIYIVTKFNLIERDFNRTTATTAVRVQQRGIPVGEEREDMAGRSQGSIFSIVFATPQDDSHVGHYWTIRKKSTIDPLYSSIPDTDDGVYIKMPPAKVRQKYFSEDTTN